MSVMVTDKYEDVDFNDLLAKLSEEDIEQLSLELIDPDVSCLPSRVLLVSTRAWHLTA